MTSPHPMRVLLWSPKGSSEQYHGPGSFAYRQYSIADPADVQVTLAHGYEQQPREPIYHDQHYVPSGRGMLGTLKFLRNSSRWLAKHAADFDVFHGLVAYHPTVQPAFEAHRLGLPAVVFVATHRAELIDKPGIRGILGWPRKRRQMIGQLDGVIAMSRAIYEELMEYGVDSRRIARIPMGVNTERFKPVHDAAERSRIRHDLGLADRPTLLFVGAIIRRKRPHLLVEAVSQMVQAGHDLQLVLVGPADEPDYEQEICQFIQQNKLEESVKLVGFTPTIEQFHRAAEMFALPARAEGMPAALVEAMSSGLACLGTQISGISDLIQDHVNGFIVEPSADSIVLALTQYMREPGLLAEHGARCRADIERQYSAESVLQAYLKLFRCVIDGRDACESSTLPEFS